jgi:23S rRNA (guanosine2251-2'-O)-methyltransferase
MKKSFNQQKLMLLIKRNEIPLQMVPIDKLNRLTRKNHQGVLALISPISFHRIENLLPIFFENGKTPLLLILDRITDVRNFGAILRTAVCAGIDAVIIPTKETPYIGADSIKTSSGAIFRIPICKENDLKKTIFFLKNSGIRILAATEKAKKLFWEEDLTLPLALILGSEKNGIHNKYITICDYQIKIPVQGINSLNVSTACGIALYETLRQRTIRS